MDCIDTHYIHVLCICTGLAQIKNIKKKKAETTDPSLSSTMQESKSYHKVKMERTLPQNTQNQKGSATGITGSTQKDDENSDMKGENARTKEITGVKGKRLEEDTKKLLRDVKILKQDFKKL